MDKIRMCQNAVLLLIFLIGTLAIAQEESWPGIKDSLYSSSLKENRQFQIILPKDYEGDKKDLSYEVLYVLDGQYYMKDVPFIYNWTVQSGYMPEMILVIIPNKFIEGVNQRRRDFTPTIPNGEEKEIAVAGGADNFLSFLQNELAPHIEKTYRTNGNKSLLGSSLSGLFVAYAFVQNPDFFNSYIASDPALWWDNEYVGNLAAERLPNFSNANSTFWMAGLDNSYEGMGSKKMDSVLTSENVNNPNWKCKLYSNETHFSVQLKAFYDGLRFSYFGYNSGGATRYHPKSGILEEGKPIKVQIFNANPLLNITFTTNESEPVKTSKRINEGDAIIISEPTKLKIKSFGNRKDFDTLEEGNFTSRTSLPKKGKGKRDSKITYSYFEGSWNTFPDSKTLQANHTVTIDKNSENLKLKKDKSDHIHLIEWDFEVHEEGYYIFGVTSEEGAKLSIGGLKLMDFEEEDSTEQSFVVALNKGFYPIRLEIFTREESGEVDFGCYYANDFADEWWESEISVLPKISW